MSRLQLTATKAGATAKADPLRFARADGSSCELDMPRQGVLPHDLIHFVVESGLALRGGFLSLIAGGAQAGFAMSAAHEPLHPAASQLAQQAEALVEALQTQLWAGSFDSEAFVYGAQTAAAARGIPAWPGLANSEGLAVFEAALTLQRAWQDLPVGQALQLTFTPPT